MIPSTTLTPEDDGEGGYTPYEDRPETYIVPIVFFLIFIVGVLGNGTLVVIFLRHRAMRNVPNTYIFSLALADLLVIITCVPFTSIIYTVESWPWGVLVCKLSETTKNISIGVSVFTLTALSVERYCAIVNPLRRLQTKPLTVTSAGLIWLVAAGFAIPDAIYSTPENREITGSNDTIRVCTPFPNNTVTPTYVSYNVVTKFLVYYVIPLGIIACFYLLMAIRLQASANEMPGENKSAQSAAQAKARKHVARMVMIFVFLFFICFLPYHIFMLWFFLYPDALNDYNEWWHSLKIIGFCLSFMNSCVNPVALYCVSGVFRAHFNKYLCCQGPRWPRNNTFSATTCETNFNSTYRRHTQGTTIDQHSMCRKGTLCQKYVPEGNLISFEHSQTDSSLQHTIILRDELELDKTDLSS